MLCRGLCGLRPATSESTLGRGWGKREEGRKEWCNGFHDVHENGVGHLEGKRALCDCDFVRSIALIIRIYVALFVKILHFAALALYVESLVFNFEIRIYRSWTTYKVI